MAVDFDTTRALLTSELQNTDNINAALPALAKVLENIEDDNIKLKVTDLKVDESAMDNRDISKQQKVKSRLGIWSNPVKMSAQLIDKKTGEVVDSVENMKIADVPKVTDRNTYIIGGNEYQYTKQLRLKPGVYTQKQNNGEITSFINADKTVDFERGFNRDFKIKFDPESKLFKVNYANRTVPLISALKITGADENKLKEMWGNDIYEANAKRYKNLESDTKAMYSAVFGKTPPQNMSLGVMKSEIRKRLSTTKVDPGVTRETLGNPFSNVSHDVLALASKKIIDINRGEAKPDDREALIFKTVHDADTLIKDNLLKSGKKIVSGTLHKLRKSGKIKGGISTQTFNPYTSGTITTSQLSNPPLQQNTLSIIGEGTKTTVMGEGGIGSSNAVTEKMRRISNTEAGFLDPMHTPEGGGIGVTNHLAMGAVKHGDKLYAPHRTPDGTLKMITPEDRYNKYTAFADEYDLDGDKPKPKSKKVKAIYKDEIVEVDPKKIDYIIDSPQALFDSSVNLIPFLDSIQANRGLTASKMQEQAVSLKDRENPLFDIVSNRGDTSFTERIAQVIGVPKAPVSGEVESVQDGLVTIKDKSGKIHNVEMYNNFSLNGESFLHNEPLVKPGDKVKSGQALADNNFTKGGKYALGVNLDVAYTPWKGYNFEDSTVVSESAAKKLTSQHMYDIKDKRTSGGVFSKSKFKAYYPEEIKSINYRKLDRDGVIKPGEVVEPGDVVVAHLEKQDASADDIAVGRLDRQLKRDMANMAKVWDKPHKGIVTGVEKSGNSVVVNIKTEEPLKEADKIVGLHGNKHIVSKILPDSEMPFNPRTGKNIDITMSPIGVSNRINASQILEAQAGKIAKETGRPYKIKNFADQDNAKAILEELGKLGLSDKETLINPDTGKPIRRPIETGIAHVLKQEHKIDHKFSARYREGHDAYEQAVSGGETGGKHLGRMEIGAMLARGAYANLREMYDIKGQKNDEWWRALETGQTPPPVKNAYVWDKLVADMKGAGINVEQDGKQLTLKPLTDKDVDKISAGKLFRPTETYRKKNFAPVNGGLFDPSLTGGMQGGRWAHIELPEKILNPITTNAAAALIGTTRKNLDDVIHGKKFVHKETGNIVSPGVKGAISGGAAVEKLLQGVDMDKVEQEAKSVAKTAKSPVELNKAHKKLRYIKALRENGMTPADYMVSKIPVTPPKFRPVFQMGGGDQVVISDENELYQSLAQSAEALKGLKDALKKNGMPEDVENIELAEVRGQIHDDLRAIQGLGDPTNFLQNIKNKKGFIKQIDGDDKQTKHGFFQKRVMQRRQDLVGRSTITLDPAIDSDHIGIPKEMATEIFKPFIIKELVGMGYTPLDAKKEIEKNSKVFQKARQIVADKRLVIANRAPTLHKYNMTAFKPILTDRKSIDVSGNLTSMFGHDYDGDAFQIHTPISDKALKEAEAMFPSRNVLKAGYDTVLTAPAQDAIAGLWMASKGLGGVDRSDVDSVDKLEEKVKKGDVSLADQVKINGRKSTAIMHLINKDLHPDDRVWDKVLDKNQVHNWIKSVSEKHKGDSEGLKLADKLRDLGNLHTTNEGLTFGVSDMTVDHNIRNQALKMAKELEKKEGIVPAYAKATKFAQDRLIEKHQDDDIGIAVHSGAGKGIGNTSQITMMPGVLMDALDQPIPMPVTRSYSEGQKSSDYWAATHGARGGNIKKSVQSFKPGHMTKDLISSLYETRIASDTPVDDEGVEYDVTYTRGIKNRYLAQDVRDRFGKIIAKKNEAINDDAINRFSQHGVKRVRVQSPLTDPTPGDGFSAYSYGLDLNNKQLKRGDNIGIMSAHTVTEPSLNLAMKSFHTGGAFQSKGDDQRYDLGSAFDVLDRTLRYTKTPPDKATLAAFSGKVKDVKKSPAGGYDVEIDDGAHSEIHYVGHGNKPVVKPGDRVEKGQLISNGTPNPHEYLELNGMRKTQEYLADTISKINEDKLDRRDVETIVRGITNTTRVEDPGDTDYTPGDRVPFTTAEWFNKQLVRSGKRPIRHKPFLAPLGIGGKPSVSENWLGRLTHSRLKDVFMEGSTQGWKTKVDKFEGSPLPDLMITEL